MFRGFVYSFIAVSLFLVASVFWMLRQEPLEDTLILLGGWMLLISFFAVGPLFFLLGYWHHLRLHRGEPQWDTELGE